MTKEECLETINKLKDKLQNKVNEGDILIRGEVLGLILAESFVEKIDT